MDAAGLDALVVMNPASVFYLSGFQTFAVDGGACLIVPRQGEPAIVMDPPEFGSAWLSVWFEDLRGYPPGSDRPAYAARCLPSTDSTAAASAPTTPAGDRPRPFVPDWRKPCRRPNSSTQATC